jgi:hypothetical protein
MFAAFVGWHLGVSSDVYAQLVHLFSTGFRGIPRRVFGATLRQLDYMQPVDSQHARSAGFSDEHIAIKLSGCVLV